MYWSTLLFYCSLSILIRWAYSILKKPTKVLKIKRRYLKNGNSDFKNSITLQIANLILYNFYLMQRYIFRTPKGLK